MHKTRENVSQVKRIKIGACINGNKLTISQYVPQSRPECDKRWYLSSMTKVCHSSEN